MPNSTDFADVHIRNADSKDRSFILALVPQLVAFGPPPWRDARQMTATDAQVIGEALADQAAGCAVLVAEDAKGTPLGFVHLRAETDYYTRSECGHVADVVVAPEAQGRGVGRALMAAGEQWARERGYGMLTLNVSVHNARARALYEGLGFGADTIRYVKDLR